MEHGLFEGVWVLNTISLSVGVLTGRRWVQGTESLHAPILTSHISSTGGFVCKHKRKSINLPWTAAQAVDANSSLKMTTETQSWVQTLTGNHQQATTAHHRNRHSQSEWRWTQLPATQCDQRRVQQYDSERYYYYAGNGQWALQLTITTVMSNQPRMWVTRDGEHSCRTRSCYNHVHYLISIHSSNPMSS